jgi:hypothetical protein
MTSLLGSNHEHNAGFKSGQCCCVQQKSRHAVKRDG